MLVEAVVQLYVGEENIRDHIEAGVNKLFKPCTSTSGAFLFSYLMFSIGLNLAYSSG